MSQKLADSAYGMLAARLRWETRQRTFYTMRHDGLPRMNKPFASAADAHYPAIDMAIRKLKPFLMGLLTSGDLLCNLTSLKGDLAGLSDQASKYFDFVLMQRTKFLRKMRVVIDSMLLRGRGVIKATVDPLDDYNLVFEAIDPLFILMPQEANGFEDADEFVHVRQFTVESYQRLDARWDTSPATIAKIRGQPLSNLQTILVQKKLQEGITHTTQENQIIVYEHWVKTRGGHTLNYYSPHAPGTRLRKSHGNPFQWQGKESMCFHGFQLEVCAEGWYAPRGIAELLAPIEQYLTKLWNEKADAMTFANRPLYTGEKEIQNLANYRWQPGEYIPGNIRGVQQGTPPFNFDNEINFARQIGEQQSQSPDFGIAQPGDQSAGGKPRTATENNRIGTLQQTGVTDTGNLFREDLGGLFRHSWGMIVQFRQREFSYFAAGELNTLPAQALHDAYLVEPDGSPDGWNRMARLQKALGLAQATLGSPNVNPEPIWKEVLAAYGNGMVQKAFVPTNLKSAIEAEDQAKAILLLTATPPYPVQVKPQDNHAVRIQTSMQWIEAAVKMKRANDPTHTAAVMANIQQHLEMLKAQSPKTASMVEQALHALTAKLMAEHVATNVAGLTPPLNGRQTTMTV